MIGSHPAALRTLFAGAVIMLSLQHLSIAQEPRAGSAFDAAPFAMELDGGDPSPGLRWGEPRKIRQIVVEWADGAAAPAPESVHVQYWHNEWDGRADVILSESSTGGQGWAKMDDWTNGKWRDAKTDSKVDGGKLIFTFRPSTQEFSEVAPAQGVTFRKTLKVRLQSSASLPKISRIQAFTDAVLKPRSVRVVLGPPADASVKIDGADHGVLEIFNGVIVGVGGNRQNAATRTDWNLGAAAGELMVDFLAAADPIDDHYDRTIVTVRSSVRPFSFAADEVARGDRILVDDLGGLVVKADDTITLEGYRAKLKELGRATVYDRVATAREQTLRRAWNDMPVRRPMFYPHGLPGDRNVFRQLPNGDVDVSGNKTWFDRPHSSKDSDRKDWKGEWIKLTFGFPLEDSQGGRELLEGRWPLLRTWWKEGPLYYELSTICDSLTGKLDSIAFDDPTVLLMQLRVLNISPDTPGVAHLLLGSTNPGEKIVVQGNRAMGEADGKGRLRYLITGKDGTFTQQDAATAWSSPLKPGETRTLLIALPSITLTQDDEIEALARRNFDADAKRVVDFWRKLNDGGTVVETPEPWLNDFYQTHLRHMVINCYKDGSSDRLLAHVGTFGYGVFTNESAMMISDLDRRGHHDLAERCLNAWLEYQGKAGLPGNFKSKEGLFYSAARHEMGGYNKSHGYAMWNMAEHWRFTRDRKWMEAASPKLVKACDWVINERKANMRKNADGSRPFEYGWLPTGGLEDVQDYWHWLATNAATVWGFDGVAAALADYGHPEAGRLVREAKAYHDDVVAGLTEARILSPVVRLRDGTYVPKFPSRLYERGRSHGWIRETLEGSMFLPVMGLVDPNSVQARWILKDYEDNLYVSPPYGYPISDFERFWLSRGGFSMQAQLLDGPIPYIQRDEPRHFLRAYFNGFASAFEPDIRMCNEHSLPELGRPAGDMFKTSDEAQSTYWMRLIFVHEQGDDLFLGQAVPRYWLAQGQAAGIERAASYFGPLTFRLTSDVANGKITATLTPPERNRPKTIYVRFRHPDEKLIQSVTVNGQPCTQFDAKKEWVILPGSVQGPQEIVAKY